MLERDQLNLLADKFEARFADVNRRILEDIGRTLKKTGDLTPSQARKLQQMYNYGADLDSMTRQLARAAGMSLEDIEAFYTQAAKEGYDWYRPFYEAKGMKQIPFAENAVLQGIVKSAAKVTAGELRNMSRTTTVGVKGAQGFQSLGSWYRKTVDDAVTAVATGTKDYNSAIRQAVKDLGNSGLRVEYESGYTRRLDSAVRQNVLDGVRYISQETARQAGEKFGADGVELDAHAPCAPDHLPYQGRQFSNQEYERLQRSLPRPIGEWNCGHFAHPILLGISKPAYSAAELAEMERYSTEKIEIDGKEYTRYECGQLQRQLETKMRYAREEKALYKTVGDKELERAAVEKLRVLGNKYTEVSRKAGLPTKMERTKTVTGRMRETGLAGTGKPDIMKLPKASEAVIPKEKLTGYALNPLKDKNKAEAFERVLGYNTDNADKLIEQIRRNLTKYPAKEKPDTGYGVRYEVLMAVTGENGRTANVKTAWILDKDTGEMRLTSLYVTKKKPKG